LLARANVGAASVSPSLLGQLDPAAAGGVDTWVVGSERVSAQLVAAWAGRSRMYNAYGPTESTVLATTMRCQPGEAGAPPIGRPLGNVRVHVLDRSLNPVPVGVPGELYIGGLGLARGYAGQPDLTAERFVADPFTGDRLYRSGDLARWRPDGTLDFVGRADEQVKVRGFRIEPAEIEHTLRLRPDVTDAVVVADGERLVAYVVGDVDGLREWAAARLPQYMVPAVFVELTSLPLNRNGKVDRAALPAVDGLRPELDGFVAPRGATQEVLAGIWAQLLEVDRVGATDNFFALGGHSLLATRVVSRVRTVFGAEVPVAALFDAPTVAGLALAVEAATPVASAPSIVPVRRGERLPLSFAQQRLWFLQQLEPGSVEYNMPTSVHLAGALDADALAAALTTLVARHEALRTRLVPDADGVPWQVVDPAPERLEVPVVDVDRDAVEAWLAADAAVPFDLAAGPVFRATLLRVAADEHVLALAMHHVAGDEWSAGIVRRELDALYAGTVLEPLPVQYADFAVWQRQWLTGDVLDRQLGFWRAALADMPTLELPTDRPRPAVRSSDGASIRFTVPPEVLDGLRALSRGADASMFMTVLSAYAVLLSRYTGQDDVPVGAPIANRNRAEIEGLVGFFVNTLVLRADLTGDPTFAELLDRVRAVTLAAHANQDVPFERLVDELGVVRDRSRTPLFQALFDYIVDPAAGGDEEADGSVAVAVRAKFDLRLVVVEGPQRLSGSVEYNSTLFDDATMRRLVAHLQVLLAAVAAGGSTPLSGLPVLTPAERHDLAAGFNDTAAALPPVRGAHELFEAAVATGPDRAAVVSGAVRLTFAELDARANRLAHHLRGLGVGPESVVGLCLRRTPDLVVALLAVWKAGGAYLPLDPQYPVQRLAVMLADSRATVVIGDADTLDDLPTGLRRTVTVDDPAIARAPSAPPAVAVEPDQLAYVIYTSGSTGTPKGVQVTHRGLVNYLSWAAGAYGSGGELGAPVHSSLGFDLTVTSLLVPLVCGSAAVLVDDDGGLDGLAAVATEIGGFDLAKLTPAHLRALGELLPAHRLGGFARRLVVGGEALTSAETRVWLEHAPDTVIVNEYGPTETVVGCCVFEMRAGDDGADTVPIGRPIANTTLLVLDAALNLVPVGVVGELYIGGVGVARGYAGRPDLTAERFIAAEGGSRVYRSGDRVRRAADGLLEYLGRADTQLKVRGFRIEPGEVELALTAHPQVDAAVVVADAGRLVAYVVGEADGLREWMAARLPQYLVPAVFVELTTLPLNRNGKVDRAALPAPDTARAEPGTAFVAASTPVQRALDGIWTQVLGVERIGIHDNFFTLGGHSLLATQVVSRLRAAFDVELPVAALFDTPTIAGLARTIEASAPGVALPPITPVERGGRLPLSFAQQRLWFLQRLEPESVAYNTPMLIPLDGPLDVEALTGALTALVARHEVLRTRLVADEHGAPWQVIDPAPERFDLPVVDELGPQVPFDLATGPLFRASLLRVAAEEHVLALAMHHVVSDEWSAGILRRELDALYAGLELPALPVQYADFAAWQRRWLAGDALDAQLAAWRERLAGAPVLDLPADRPRPAVRSSAGAAIEFSVPAEVAAGLRAVSRAAGASMFMTAFGVFSMLLSRYTGQDDIAVGTPIANRNRAEIESLIGFFVNTLVLRTDLSGDPTFTELLARVRATTLDAYAHQDVPFERLVDELDVARDRSRTPLFQVLFNFIAGAEGPAPAAGVSAPRPLPVKFDLTVTLAEAGDGLAGSVQYSTALFDTDRMLRLVSHLTGLLAEVAADPGAPLSALRMLDAAEVDLVAGWNDTAADVPWTAGVLGAFAESVAATPDAVAVECGAERLTYRELDARSDALAGHLAASGVGVESVVGVCLDRSVELAVAVWGVWKAGAAYLPLDPGYPPARLAELVADSGAALVLDAAAVRAGVVQARPVPAFRPGRLAYVIYTSGSTGRPKAVLSTHEGLANRIWWMQRQYGLEPGERVLHKTPITFDVSVWELVWPLTVGGRMVMAEPGRHGDVAYLVELIDRAAVGVVHFVPSLFHEFVREPWPAPMASLRLVVCSGEALAGADVAGFQARHDGAAVENLYGPTEASIDVTSWSCARAGGGAVVPIGAPIANTRVEVLDAALRPVPVGVPGELYLGGVGLARGYHGRPELTAERFVAAAGGVRLYRTGDVAVWRGDGQVLFLGRADHQVKVRGVRIEPGEIEAVLGEHPRVASAVVVADGDRLVAYVVGEAHGLREWVAARLPQYLVPAVFVELTAIPLNRNGKVDRAALPAVDGVRSELAGAYVAPSGPVQEVLAGIWAGLLGVDRVGADDDFFAVGGHSLLATQVVSRVRGVFGVEVPVGAVFDAPTVAGLARAIEAATPGLEAPAIVPVDRGGPLPLSFAQQRLWFLHRLEPQSLEYNLRIPIDIDGELDAEALVSALTALVARHEALRTRLVADADGVPWQVIEPAPERFEPAVADEPPGETPFDLAAGPLFRATLTRLAGDRHLLVLSMHHVVGDEWSSGVLRRELEALYRGVQLPALPVQYADFAVWQRQWLTGEVLDGQLGYWRQRLAGAPGLDLPADRPRPAVWSPAGAAVGFELDEAVSQRLRAVARDAGASMFMTLFGAFTVLLSRYTGQDDIVVGTPIANRNRAEVEDLIGFFVNTLVLRTDLSGDPTFADLLGRVRADALAAFAHQDLPFERLVDELGVARDRSRAPLFQVLFNYFEVEQRAGADREDLLTRFDLRLIFTDDGAGLSGTVEYATALFDRPTIERLAGHLVRLLGAIAADADGRLSDVTLLAPDEVAALASWNDTDRALPSVGGVHELIGTGDAVAVSAGGVELTYSELDEASNRLAHLLRGAGVGAESVVGVAVERGPDMAVLILAVWKAGGAYLPLDVSLPAERLAVMLTDAGALIVAGTADALDEVPVGRWRTVVVDSPGTTAALAGLPATAPDVRVDPRQLAYVIFTSGSTGRPKGVLVPHAGIVNLCLAQQAGFEVNGGDGVLQFASMSFDASVSELVVTLAAGGRLVVAGSGVRSEPAELARVIAEGEVRVATLPPSLLAVLDPADLPGIRTLVAAGERLDREVARRWAAGRRLINAYGPTEATVCASMAVYDGGAPAIGGPIANVRLQVVDAQLRPVPVGVPGELLIGGVGVARGYTGRAELTAERFIAAEDGSRVYRSGDLVRWSADGRLEYLGRLDAQVKVRGFRVEPGEVESVLLTHPRVSAAVVVADGDRLVAYVVGETDGLRAYLGVRLPEYLVPAVFVELTGIPMTVNGKVDRAALPAVDARPELAGEFVAPTGATQELLAGIWGELLGVDRVGAADNFFELGGHSLLATQVMSRIRAAFDADLPVAALFETPTVAGLAGAVDDAAPGGATPPIVPVSREQALPLSFGQQRLWFLAELEPGSAEYNTPMIISLDGELDPEALTAALTALVGRHEVLRTRLVAGEDGVPRQAIDPAPDRFDVPVVEVAEDAVRAWLAADGAVPFDLAAGPLFRATLLRIAPDRHMLALAMHHVVGDEWSVPILRRELEALYAGAALPPLPVQYADFAAWQRQWLTGDVLAEQVGFWRERLSGAPLLELPADRPRPAVWSPAGGAVRFDVPDEVTARLRAVARDAGASMFMTLFGAFTVLLSRYTGQDDIVVGTPIANRNRAEVEDLIGFFVNTLVLRTDLSGDPTFADLVGRVRAQALAAFEHQDLPFERLVDELGVARDRSRAPLFQVLFNYFASAADRAGDDSSDLLTRFDLRLIFTDDGTGLSGAVEYATALFDRSTVERLTGHLVELLGRLAVDAGRRLSELPLLSGPEATRLASWNDTDRALPSVGGVHELFGSGDGVAVSAGGAGLTYAQLQERSNRVAHALVAAGVRAESVVGVAVERGIDMAVLIVAVWKAGGAYLPLDVSLPADRLAGMLADAGVSVVAGTGAAVDELPMGRWRSVLMDGPGIAAMPDTAPDVRIDPRQLAYVIFTSGSTGRPKGVLVPHAGLVNLCAEQQAAFGVGPGDGVLQFASMGFDASVWELVMALAAGARLVVAESGVRSQPAELARVIADGGVRIATLPPSLLAVLQTDDLAGLRTVIAAGERLDVEVARRWADRYRLVNAYGPTEATVCASMADFDGDVPSIGGPIGNARLQVVDAQLRPVPVGVYGELLIGGAGVARAYAGRPDLTAERFIAAPGGARWYRTGDVVRWSADGRLEYLGRLDAQVKVRGFRVEPGEVESVLLTHPRVSAAVVVADGDRLVAYVVGETDGLRAYLGVRLPEYLVPAVFVELTGIPMTVNGKVDRAALPAVDGVRPQSAAGFVAPSGATQELLAGIWGELLGVDRVGVNDTFFELGGHSLLATQVMSRVRAVLGADLPVSALFDAPTVARLAVAVDAAGAGVAAPAIVPVHRDRPLPLSFAQQRLWFLHRLEPGSVEYNAPMTIALEGELDVAALSAALAALVARHEVLRTRLVADEHGVPWQVIDPAPERFDLPVVDELGPQVPFDLAAGPLFRASLLRVSADEHVLALSMHHVVGDEWSAPILRRELETLYAGAALPPMPVQYADFAVWQRQWLTGDVLAGQVGFWRDRLAGAPTLDLPTDRPRPAVRSAEGAAFEFAIPAAVADGLRMVARGAD
ncbi:non-ribosomal peptide synthetase, partial [Dactylosporangium siamense]|uniref:non-ribosomal peptide synthetase n=1 Tax=Dactylosporangium siamense TaxID=685454 RepID=UPI00194562FE